MGNFKSNYGRYGRGGLAGVLAAIRNKPLDETHSPFKRSDETGEGPKGSGRLFQGRWLCSYLPPTMRKVERNGKKKKVPHYQQLCKLFDEDGQPKIATKGPNAGKQIVKIVRRAKDTKQTYNSVYEKFLASPKRTLPDGTQMKPHNNPNSFRVTPTAYTRFASESPKAMVKVATFWAPLWAEEEKARKIAAAASAKAAKAAKAKGATAKAKKAAKAAAAAAKATAAAAKAAKAVQVEAKAKVVRARKVKAA